MKVLRILLYTFFLILLCAAFIFFGGGRVLINAGRGLESLELKMKKHFGALCQQQPQTGAENRGGNSPAQKAKGGVKK